MRLRSSLPPCLPSDSSDSSAKLSLSSSLKCPFCKKSVPEKWFRAHLFGCHDDDAVQLPKCAKIREIYPNGIPVDIYNNVRQAVLIERQLIVEETDEAHAAKRVTSQKSQLLTLNYSEGGVKKKSPLRARKSFSSTSVAELQRQENSESASSLRMGICGLCDEFLPRTAMLFLPCCNKQLTCLWCIVAAAVGPGDSTITHRRPTLNCSKCNYAIVLPTTNTYGHCAMGFSSVP